MAEERLPRNPSELADHADDFVAAIGTPTGLTASGLDPAQITALTDAMTALRASLTARNTAETAYRAAVEAAQEAHETAEALYRGLRQQASNHTNMTDPLREQARLTVPDDKLSPGVLPEILDLTAQGHASGANFLDWSGPTSGGLRYEVFASETAGGPWSLVGSATQTAFVHHDAGAGLTRHYRVIARRGEREGLPSNEASVYV